MTGVVRRAVLCLFAGLFWCAWTCAEGWQHLGAVRRVEKLGDGIEVTAGRAKVRITTFNAGVIRVRVAPEGSFAKDFSWAVIESPNPASLRIEDAKNEVRLVASNVTVVVQKAPLLINFLDASGNMVL